MANLWENKICRDSRGKGEGGEEGGGGEGHPTHEFLMTYISYITPNMA